VIENQARDEAQKTTTVPEKVDHTVPPKIAEETRQTQSNAVKQVAYMYQNAADVRVTPAPLRNNLREGFLFNGGGGLANRVRQESQSRYPTSQHLQNRRGENNSSVNHSQSEILEKLASLTETVAALQKAKTESQAPKKVHAADVYYRVDPVTNEETNEIIEIDNKNKSVYPDDFSTDLYEYVEDLHYVSNSRFKDRSLQKKIEILEKRNLKEWNSNTCKSVIQHLYVEYHRIGLQCNFDMYTIAYFLDRNFMHGRKRDKVRQVIIDNCREYVQNERILAAVKNGEMNANGERLSYCRKNLLTEYRLKNIIYFCVAECIQPNFKSLDYPPWQDAMGEDLTDFYAKVLAIYKMKVSTNRHGIRATEKREALEDMLKTLYGQGRRDICSWINKSEKLDFFRSGNTKDLPIEDIETCLQTAQIRLTQERESEKVRSQYCTFAVRESDQIASQASTPRRSEEENDWETVVNSGSDATIAAYARKFFRRATLSPFGRRSPDPGNREGKGRSMRPTRPVRRNNRPSEGRTFRRESFRQLNDRFPERRQRYNRADKESRFNRRNKLFRRYRDNIRKEMSQLVVSDMSEDEFESRFDEAGIVYALPVEDKSDQDSDIEETELAEVNSTYLVEENQELECYFVPNRQSDLLYANVRFAIKPSVSERALLDCGSSANLITKTFLEVLSATHLARQTAKTTNIYGFNDAKTAINEEVVLEMNVGPMRVKTSFYVVPGKTMSSQRIILGKPALLKLGLWQEILKFTRQRLNQ